MSVFTASDGTSIGCRVRGERSAGTPVLLHHGFAVDAKANWVAPGIVPALVAAGLHVVSRPDFTRALLSFLTRP